LKDFLGQKEADYIAQKAAKSTDLWKTYLAGVGLADFDVANFTTPNPVAGETVPNIGIAMSGGGIRALIGGAGILDAFDNRNPEAVDAGTGGILQLANYITGLSG
jgi:lysophospholipase